MTIAASLLMLALTSTASPAAGSSELDTLRVPWTEPSGQSLSFAYDNGSWGGNWTQSVRVFVPFGDHFGGLARGLVMFGGPTFGERIDVGGRLELIGRSPVLLNFVRLYGGGGISLMSPVHGVDKPQLTVGGGGQFGFEFFMTPHIAWTLEVGGNSGSQDGFGSGATILAGINIYPF
ncbi:MAG: hypothetical protein U1E65_31580 [Myxococcota bacterium]